MSNQETKQDSIASNKILTQQLIPEIRPQADSTFATAPQSIQTSFALCQQATESSQTVDSSTTNYASSMTSNLDEAQLNSTSQVATSLSGVTHTTTKPLIPNEEPIETSSKSSVIDEAAVPIPESQSPSRTVTKVRLATELNIFDWFSTSDIINQIAERTKSTVDTVITTLDPGMKEYLYSGGNINIVVISDSTNSISPTRNSFQSVFGRATVSAASSSDSQILQYPVQLACGFKEAETVAKERIYKFRSDTSNVAQNQVIVVLQPTLIDWRSMTSNVSGGEWFLTYCMFIEDPVLGIFMSSYSQFIPIDSDIITIARASKLPDDFQEKHLGFAISIDELMLSKLNLNLKDECSWIRSWTSLDEAQVIGQLGFTLANQYKRKWDDCLHQ